MNDVENKSNQIFHQNYFENIFLYLDDNKDVANVLQLNKKCNQVGNAVIAKFAELEEKKLPPQSDEETASQELLKQRWTKYRDGQEIGKKIAIIEKFTKVYALRRKLFERIQRMNRDYSSPSDKQRNILSLLNPVNLALISCGEAVVLIAEIAQHLFLGIRSAFAALTQPAEKTLAKWHFRKLGCDVAEFFFALLTMYPLLAAIVYIVALSHNSSAAFSGPYLNDFWTDLTIPEKIKNDEIEVILQCALASLPDKIPEKKDIIFWDHLGREWKLDEFWFSHGLVATGHSGRISLSDSSTPKGQKIAKRILAKLGTSLKSYGTTARPCTFG